MQHKILNLLVASLVALVVAGPAAAANALRLGTATAPPGAAVELALDVRGDAAAMQWDLRYPDAALALESVTLDHDGFRVDSAHVGPGHLRVVVRATACAATPPAAVTGRVRLRVDPAAAPGRHLLAVDAVLAVGVDGSTLDAGPDEDGAIIVAGSPAPAAVPIPTLGLPALLALLALVFIASLLALRTRALTMWLVAAVVFASAPPPVRAGTGPDLGANIVDVILGRGGDASLADCNGDGRVDVADLACAQAAACAGTTDGSPTADGAKAGDRAGTLVPRDGDPVIFGDGFEGDDRPNLPPVLDPIDDRSLLVGEVLRIQLRATDPNPGDRLRYALDAAPVGVALDAQTGALQWAPASDQAGDRPITVRVTDAEGLFDTASFTVSVNRRGGPPVLADIADRTLVLGESLALTATASDPDLPDDTLTFAIVAAPAGLSLDPASGAIAWTPQADQVGVHEVTIEVLDRIGLSDFTRFVVTVRAPNGAPLARDDGYITPRGETTTIVAPGVIGNDEDPDGDALTASLVDGPSFGTLDFRPDGSFDYRPGAVGVPFAAEQAFRHAGAGWPSGFGTVFWATAAAIADLDGDGIAEVVSHGQRAGGAANARWLGVFRADADSGQLVPVHARHYHQGSTEDPRWIFEEGSYPSLADLDGDGLLEVILPAYCDAELVVYRHDLSPWFVTSDFHVASDPTCAAGVFSDSRSNRINIADLDGDGTPELVQVANRSHADTDVVARNADGSVRWMSPLLPFSGSDRIDVAPVVIADLDLDGRAEIMVKRFVLEHDGSLRFAFPGPPHESSGFGIAQAVANLDDDAFGELLLASPFGGLEARNHDGTCLWRNFWASGSPPTNYDCPVLRSMPLPSGLGYNVPRELYVADIDRDGEPEIVLITRGGIHVFERDGTLIWRDDPRIGGNRVDFVTAAVFDFDGDGYMEIVLGGASEGSNLNTGIQIRDGRDGSILQEIPGSNVHPGTGGITGSVPNAIQVADLDGDRRAEFLVVAGGFSQLGNAGLFAYRSANVPWMPARPMWNQWDYQITNIAPDGSMPARPRVNWLEPGLNNYRVNVPTLEEPGGFDQFTYRVSDGTLESDTATVALEIRRGNRAPVILSQPPSVVGAGFAYRYPVLSFDGDPGDSVTLALARGPAGMTLGADRTVRWSPTSANLGEHPVVVSARDTEGAIAVQSWTLRVVEAQPVPDVVGQPQAAAVAAIEAAGFTSGRIEQRDHPTVPVGAVAVQTPPGGANEPPGSAIALVVSTGPGPADRDADGDTYTPNGGDCNDADPTINPAATDPFGDGIDQDCDGVDGSEPVTSIRVTPGALTLLAGERAQLAASAGFADGSAQPITGAVAWSSSGGAASVDSQGRLVANSAGSATITATRQGISGTASIAVRARVAGDTAAPIAEIATPADGAAVIEPIDIVGTASDPNLVRYELAIRPAGSSGPYTLINQGETSVVGGVLGRFDPTGLMNGFYELRLRVIDAGGNETRTELTLRADGERKLGQFTLAFTDLSLPLGGLPIVLERVYDSRQLTVGDFGVGWRLGLRSIELNCASPLGENWQVLRGGLSFSLVPTREKACALNLPGGRMEVFDIEANPGVSPLVPFVSLSLKIKPRSGTLGRLELLDNDNLLVLDPQPGPVSLIDDTTFQVFRPRHFRYTMPDGTRFDFTDGRVTRVTDGNGNSLAFSVSGIEHSSGIGVSFERDALGRITSITDPSGHRQTYTYSANGDLSAHTDALGNTTRFFYNSRHGLVRIEDPLGNSAVRSEYDARGRLIAVVDAAGNRTEHSYDDEARRKTTVFPDGSTLVVAYDERGNVQQQRRTVTIDGVPVFADWSREYDDAGNPTRIVDADGVVQEAEWNDAREWTRRVIDPAGLDLVEQQDFDGMGRPTSYTDALGRTRHYEYDSNGNVVLSPGPGGTTFGMTYDGQGRIRAVVNPRGERTRLGHNAAGQVISREVLDAQGWVLGRTEFTRDANGRVTAQTEVPRAGEGLPRTTTFTHDALGRITAITNPMGETTRFEYDGNGQMTAIVDPLDHRTEIDYDARGLMVERRLPDGGVERFEHDHAGRRTRHVDPDGVVRDTEYDELGRAVAERLGGQLVARRIYSPGGRVIAEIDALGHRIDHEYDSAGRRTRTLLPPVFDALSASMRRPELRFEYNELAQATARIDPLGRRTGYVYDAAGHLSRVVHPDGSERAHSFDAAGRHLSVTDEEGHSSLFEYDAAGRLVRVLQPAPAAGEPRPETRYNFDSLGQLSSRIDALGRVTAYEYDAAGRLTRVILPDGSSKATEYDAAGRPRRIVEMDGSVLELEHDPMGRLLQRSVAGLVESIRYTPAGRRSEVLDARGLSTFSYDDRGRLSGFVDGDGLGLSYQFDGNGRVTSLGTGAHATGYSWDALGRLEAVDSSAGSSLHAYDLAGQLRRMTLPNGLSRQMEYDLRGRPVNVALRSDDDSLIESFVSTYSPRGQRLSVTGSDGSVESYDYDPIGRLVSATRSGTEPFALTFEHDQVGNRLRQTLDGLETVYTYGSNNQLLTAGDSNFAYDARGNRTSAVVDGVPVSYQWDGFGRLIGAVTPEGTARFDYDIDNRRISRSVNGQRNRLLVDPQSVSGRSQVVAEFDGDGQLLARWDFGHQVMSQHRAGQVHHYGHDHRGSVRLLSDASGQITDRYAYLPFGDLLATTGNTPNPYRFNAERWEPGALSYDLRARSYDTCTGTFLSRDPFPGFEDRPFSLHPYQFADADPINHIDPSGLTTLGELSFTQSLQKGLGNLNLASRAQTVCKAKTVTSVVNKITAASQIAAFAWNFWSGKLDFKADVSVPLDETTTFKVEVNPDFGVAFGVADATPRAFTLKGTVEIKDAAPLPVMGVMVTASGISATTAIGTPIKLVGVDYCGTDIGKFSLVPELGMEVGAGSGGLSGKTTFTAKLALGFDNAAFGLLDSGGLEWTFIEISRSSSDAPVNRWLQP